MKRVRRSREDIEVSGESVVAVEVFPNPLRAGTGTLQMHCPSSGTARITVSDLMGRVVLALPSFQIQHPGEYTLPVDFTGLRNGVYLLQVDMGRVRGSTRVTVMP